MTRTTKTIPRGARTDLQIRGMSVVLRNRVRARAAKSGQTMSQYLIGLVEKDTEGRSLEEWLEDVRRWKPIAVRPGASAAQAVREAREERSEHLASVAERNPRSSAR